VGGVSRDKREMGVGKGRPTSQPMGDFRVLDISSRSFQSRFATRALSLGRSVNSARLDGGLR